MIAVLIFALIFNADTSIESSTTTTQITQTEARSKSSTSRTLSITDQIIADIGPDREYQASSEPTLTEEFCQYINLTCPQIRTFSGVPIANDTTKKLHIGIDFIPIRMVGINEIEESFSIRIDLRVYWGLPSCASWKGARQLGSQASKRLNDSLESRMLPRDCLFDRDSIYIPQLLHTNAMGDTYSIEKTGNKKVTVNNQGVATMINKNRFDSMCSLDFTFFPFDTQECFMEVSAFSADVAILWTNVNNPPEIEFISSNTIWQVVDKYTKMNSESVYTSASFVLKLQRRPNYHLLLIMAPTVVLSILQLAVFFLPFEVAERSTYSITVVLAMQVSLSAVYSEIPVTSQPVYLACYVTACQIIGAVMTIYINVAVRLAEHTKQFGKRVIKLDIIIGLCFTLFVVILNAVVFIALTKNLYL